MGSDIETRNCIECGSILNPGAVVCQCCKAHQDKWRRRATLAAQLAGLIALVGSAVAFSGRTALDVWNEVSATSKPYLIALSVNDGGGYGVTLANSGRGPAFVTNINLVADVKSPRDSYIDRDHYRLSIGEEIPPNDLITLRKARAAAEGGPYVLIERGDFSGFNMYRNRESHPDGCIEVRYMSVRTADEFIPPAMFGPASSPLVGAGHGILTYVDVRTQRVRQVKFNIKALYTRQKSSRCGYR